MLEEMTPHSWPLAGLLALALAGGCAIAYPTAPDATPSPISSAGPGTPGPTSGSGQPGTGGSPAPAVSPSPGGWSAEIEIDITGGSHEGSYRAVAPGGCDSKPAQNKFIVTYADDLAADRFVALHLVLSDVALAQQDESDSFVAEISLGGAGGGISYTIDPLNGAGSGTVLIDVSPFDATLDLSADAPDGAQVELSVICGSP